MNRLRAAVRPVITFAFAAGVTYGFFAGKITGDQYLLLATTVILFWFGSRTKPNS